MISATTEFVQVLVGFYVLAVFPAAFPHTARLVRRQQHQFTMYR